MAHRRLALSERLDQFAGAHLARRLVGDEAEEPEPGGIGQRGEAVREVFCVFRVERLGQHGRAADGGVEDGDGLAGHGFHIDTRRFLGEGIDSCR
jgi:hypothetical protein